jgi:hypothetical protein
MEVYEVRLHKDHRGIDLIPDALPFDGLWYAETDAIGYAKFRSRSHDAVIRVYDEAGNIIGTHEQTGAISRAREYPSRGATVPARRNIVARRS